MVINSCLVLNPCLARCWKSELLDELPKWTVGGQVVTENSIVSLRAYNSVGLLAGLDYTEEVYQSRILGEWSNKFGYEMVPSPRLFQ